MTNEERARLRKLADWLDTVGVYSSGEFGYYSGHGSRRVDVSDHEVESAWAELADAWIAEHPALDDEKLTAKWLSALGGQEDECGDWHFGSDGESVDIYRRVGGGVESYYLPAFGDRMGVDIATVGHLRRLLSVFGIPVTLSPEG